MSCKLVIRVTKKSCYPSQTEGEGVWAYDSESNVVVLENLVRLASNVPDGLTLRDGEYYWSKEEIRNAFLRAAENLIATMRKRLKSESAKIKRIKRKYG